MSATNYLNNALRERSRNEAERLFGAGFNMGWDACMKLRIEVLERQRDALRAQATPEFSSPRFDKTYCSHCGQEFGPGDHGYSRCEDHRGKK